MSTATGEFLTSSQLLSARAQHVDNINLLQRARKEWAGETIARGENTIANLVEQITEIDEELAMARHRRGGVA